MELQIVERRSRKIDELVRQNFGPDEDLWNPKYFDFLFKLTRWNGKDPLAICTLQSAEEYWILGDLCVKEKGMGYGTAIVDLVMKVVNQPVWVDANEISSRIFEKNPLFYETTKAPWKPEGKTYLSVAPGRATR